MTEVVPEGGKNMTFFKDKKQEKRLQG